MSLSKSNPIIGRKRPIAPTCNICLIRNDRSTLWCEVTSSIRYRTKEEDQVVDDSKDGSESGITPYAKVDTEKKSSLLSPVDVDKESRHSCRDDNGSVEAVQEILLCLRPIRDGSIPKMSEKNGLPHRYKSSHKRYKKSLSEKNNDGGSGSSDGHVVSEDTNTTPGTDGTQTDSANTTVNGTKSTAMEDGSPSKKPLKKRMASEDEIGMMAMVSKKRKNKQAREDVEEDQHLRASLMDASVMVESLMLMNKTKK